MTAFGFFTVAAYILLGIICLAIAAVILYGVIAGIRNHMREKELDYSLKLRNHKGKY